jgi:NAD(P)-dependent dehydrogenase (short-subunit alcohol dehydrogenase family)
LRGDLVSLTIPISKTTLLTGAAGGLGRAQGRALLDAGVNLVMTDIDSDALHRAQAELDPARERTIVLSHDVTSEGAWNDVIVSTLARFGRLDVLVNNAGISPFMSIEEASLQDWRRVMAVNSDSAFLGTKAAIGVMKSTGGGSIINIASISAKVTAPPVPAYSASKAAICMLSKSAALHCATQNYNIRINSVLPGPVATDMVVSFRNDPEHRAAYDRMIEGMPMHRLAEPNEIAKVVVFLALDAPSYMTGADIIVDGGFSCW